MLLKSDSQISTLRNQRFKFNMGIIIEAKNIRSYAPCDDGKFKVRLITHRDATQ